MATKRHGRIDYVGICVQLENMEDCVHRFSELLGVRFEGPFDSEQGLRVCVDFDSGLEIYAPLTGDAERPAAEPYRRFLAQHGEGIYRLSFGVRSADEAAGHGRSLGYLVAPAAGPPTAWQPGSAHPDWDERFDSWRHAALTEPIHGVRLSLTQIERGAPDSRASARLHDVHGENPPVELSEGP
jgi:hypothetical protein